MGIYFIPGALVDDDGVAPGIELVNESFQEGLGLWTTPGVEEPAVGEWSTLTTSTPTGSTGPAGGAVPGTLTPTDGLGFAFTETSGTPPDVFTLESPEIDASLGLASLTFDVHMRFGQDGTIQDGSLLVQGWNGSSWSTVGPTITGSQQASATQAWQQSRVFGTYDSTGFINTDFKFRFRFERGANVDTFNYDCSVDNAVIFGPPGAVNATPPPVGIIRAFSGTDGVDQWFGELDFPNPEQPYSRENIFTPAGLVFDGTRSMQTEIRSGDPQSFNDANAGNQERRAEYNWRPYRYQQGQVGWAGAAFYLPSDPMAAIKGCTIFQLALFPDPGNMWSLYLFDGRLRSSIDGVIQGAGGINGGAGETELMNLPLSPYLDKWVTMVINFKPSTGADGFIKMWLDDVLVIDNQAANKVSGIEAPFFKHGAYFWGYEVFDTVKRAKVLHDNLRTGNQLSNFQSVDPNNFNRTAPPVVSTDATYGTDGAPWNIPASEIGTHPNSTNIRNQIYNITPGLLNINIDIFSPAIYSIQDATINARLQITDTRFGGNLRTGFQVPWNPGKFITPVAFNGNDVDSYTVLIDQNTGLCLEFFRSEYLAGSNTLRAASGFLIQNGIFSTTGDVANIFTKDNGTFDNRACGIQHVIGLVTRQEIEAGRIPHCTTLSYPNPTRDAFVAPATKGAGFTGGEGGRGAMGYRMVWDFSDADIDNWVNTFSQNLRSPMRTLGNCMREFGAMVTDHSGTRARQRGAIQFEHQVSAKWNEIGLNTGTIGTALDGLLAPARNKARILALPQFIGGNKNNVACYPGANYPVGHPCRPPSTGSGRGVSYLASIAQFRDKITKKPFVIFHEVRFNGTSVTPESLGMIELDTVFQSAWLPGVSGQQGNPDRTLPAAGAVESIVASRGTVFVPDIEAWWPSPGNGTAPLNASAIANYIEVGSRINNSKTNSQHWGWYSTAPQRSYFAPVQGGSLLATWQQSNDLLTGITDQVDIMWPSIYTFSTLRDQDDWDKYAIGNINESRRISNNKAVVPYLWPYYHAQGTEPISTQFFRRQLTTCLEAGCEGAVVWSTSDNKQAPFSIQQSWVNGITQFIDARLEPIP